MDKINDLLNRVKEGFAVLSVGEIYKEKAIVFIKEWLTKPEFSDYVSQIEYLIEQKDWDYLLDCFYQIIPFGTAGRRGEVGVGPNRINLWTICSAAQGHCQYLLKKYGAESKSRGIVLANDVRIFLGNNHLDIELKDTLTNLSARDLACAAAEVYAANGMKVYIFDGIRTTPELSFAIRHLKTVSGAMFSASHNPPDHNGQKVFDEFGGQMIPPYDEELVNEVTKNVAKINHIDYQKGLENGSIEIIGPLVDSEYVKAAAGLSHSDARNAEMVYTPLHGCGITSVSKVMKKLGFSVKEDPKTNNPSGRFENVTFNIPNPEVIESFNASLEFAKADRADLILNSDPDADRLGVMVKHKEKWLFLNGDQICSILAGYIEEKTRAKQEKRIMIKTAPTTGLLARICAANRIELIGDLLIGYKYIAHEMNKLESQGRINDFIFACEESYGHSSGNYIREKDACTGAIWLSELTGELKNKGKTVIDYLDDIYAVYGYFNNHQTEIRLLGAAGFEKMRAIMDGLRNNPPRRFGKFAVKEVEDGWSRLPFVSETDRVSKNMLNFKMVVDYPGIDSIRAYIRPSGTEPKLKIYFEIGAEPVDKNKLPQIRQTVDLLMEELEKESMKSWYKIIDVDFPDRGFLLFWQLPLDSKMKYFQIEQDIEKLKEEPDKAKRKEKLAVILAFLGSDPVGKMDKAFAEKYGQSVLKFLDL